jgi:hypothetical protein
MIAAHSMTNTCATEVNPAPEHSRRHAGYRHVHRGVAFHRSGQPTLGLRARFDEQALADEQPEQHGQQHDHDRAADELGHGELPAHQQRQDHPQLDDQVGGADLERHRGGEVRALAEQRARQRDRGVGTRGGRRAQRGGHRERPGPVIAHQPDYRVAAHHGLHHGGQCEPEDQRPEDLPGHRSRERQRMPDRTHHITAFSIPRQGYLAEVIARR